MTVHVQLSIIKSWLCRGCKSASVHITAIGQKQKLLTKITKSFFFGLKKFFLRETSHRRRRNAMWKSLRFLKSLEHCTVCVHDCIKHTSAACECVTGCILQKPLEILLFSNGLYPSVAGPKLANQHWSLCSNWFFLVSVVVEQMECQSGVPTSSEVFFVCKCLNHGRCFTWKAPKTINRH